MTRPTTSPESARVVYAAVEHTMIGIHEKTLVTLLVASFVAASLPACSSTEETADTIQAGTDESGAPPDECDPDATDFVDTDCIYDYMEHSQ